MEAAKPIQIITLENHLFKFHPEKLTPIFERDDLKDRQVVIVSIAGAFRKGKSFLLNFFLKYLYAQYRSRNVSNWLSETANNPALAGFKWQGGLERKTTGIWMWSDIFTHDFENGNKVAIILVDTQGIFDDKSTIKEYASIFAISTMISSTQCYNLMQNIQEDDLQNLELFTGYARLAAVQANETSLQNLLFIVRDWPNPSDHSFGNGHQFIGERLSENPEQTPEKRQLRDRIRDSFKSIDGFLLPHPGFVVAEGTWGGNLEDVHPRFIKYVEELARSLFSPENLTVKIVNEQKLRVRDLVTILQTYVDVFNGDTLPEPKTVFMTTAEVNNQTVYSECIKYYVGSMESSLKAVSYLKETDFQKAHNDAKRGALAQFEQQRKLGDENLIALFKYKLETEIESKFKLFENINDQHRCDHFAKENAVIARAEGEVAEAQTVDGKQTKGETTERSSSRSKSHLRFQANAQATFINWAAQGSLSLEYIGEKSTNSGT